MPQPETDPQPPVGQHGKPPFFKKWSGMYWLLIIVLVVQILLYYWLTQRY